MEPASSTVLVAGESGESRGPVFTNKVNRLIEEKAGRFASVLQFAAVGLSGMGVDLLSFAFLQGWLPLAVARALAIWGAMTWNYILNRHLTFSRIRSASVGRQYLLFCASCLAGALTNWSISVVLCSRMAFFAQVPLAAAVIGVGAGFFLNYALSCHFVFRSGKRELPARHGLRGSEVENP